MKYRQGDVVYLMLGQGSMQRRIWEGWFHRRNEIYRLRDKDSRPPSG